MHIKIVPIVLSLVTKFIQVVPPVTQVVHAVITPWVAANVILQCQSKRGMPR